MGENSAIEWTEHTFNPWEGCQKVGPGCDHCYAETRNARYGGGVAANWGPGAPRRRTSVTNWRKPLAWQRDAERFRAEHGRRQRVFCASLADVFDNAVDPAWRADLFELIAATPDLDWLLLTKRIGNVETMAAEAGCMPPNVWLGATVVNQAEADRDVPKLLAAPARVRFLSMEPLLGPVTLGLMRSDLPQHAGWPGTYDPLGGSWWPAVGNPEEEYRNREEGLPRINWLIVGGESGSGARPMHPDWARSLRDQCAAADVPFLFKQWGEWVSHRIAAGGDLGGDVRAGRVTFVQRGGETLHQVADLTSGGSTLPGGRYMARVGKKVAGRLLDGIQHDGFPGEPA
ncbi:MAG: phage Gp37/Gp68 family protein [Polynucleobacter sp.]